MIEDNEERISPNTLIYLANKELWVNLMKT